MITADLVVEQLRVVAGGRTILDVDKITVSPGEIVAVLGPNGSGKTTLLNTCLGFRKPTSGQVQVLGRPVERLGSLALTRLRRDIGYVPQVQPVPEHMPLTLREVVAIGRTGRAGLLRPLRRDDWHVVDEWIERLGLGPLRDEPYGVLSGGEQRKALIARAMVQQPRLLVLDEPTAHLDLGWREQIVAILEQLGARNGYEKGRRQNEERGGGVTRTTMVLVCHELEVLPACCRRVVLLEHGRVVADGEPESVLTDARIRDWYGRGLRTVHGGGRHAVVPQGRATDAQDHEPPWPTEGA